MAGSALSIKFTIAETDNFRKEIASIKYRKLYEKIRDYINPQLRTNPFFGPNIKRLRGNLNDYYRYRLGNFRLFYTVDNDRVIVFIVSISDRKDAYR
jgi:mRNA interferase RelE/StbE